MHAAPIQSESRAVFGELLGVAPSQVVVDGSASLALMHDVIVYGLSYGMPGRRHGAA
ncbi:hypothetical protein ACFDR9_001331 [Janthinobacterium sp. CG_23.3]|uniref:hypothetical protein n=1 Tax=Janthinobacterium sp. CG_23.3 TaxID=3349634 RepID=UPI0038D4901E